MKKDKSNNLETADFTAGVAAAAADTGSAGSATATDFTMLQKLEEKKKELLNDLQRTRADFENYRKQIEMQKQNEREAVKLATVMKVLPLIDDMDRAILSYKELEPLKKSLEKTLKELGLTKISSEAGVEFNPDLHEAVMTEGDGETQTVAETLRPGYYYEEKVLRPAMVKVILSSK